MANLFIGNLKSPLAIERFKMVKNLYPKVYFYDRSKGNLYDKNLELIKSLYFKKIYHLSSFLFLIYLVYSYRVKIIHFHGVSVQFLSLICFLKKFKVIATPQGSDINQNFIGKHAFFTKILLNKANYVTLKSKEMQDRVLQISSPKKIIILNWGVDSVFNMDNYSRDKNTINILSPRTNKPNYNIGIIFDVIKSIKQKYNNINFIFVSLEEITDNIKDLNIADEIYFQLNSQQMARLYSKSDFMISIPSNDGFSTSIVEALMCGCLPIISELSSYKSINEVANLVYKIKEPYEVTLLKALDLLITNLDRVREESVQRKEYISNTFSREQQLKILNKIYEI